MSNRARKLAENIYSRESNKQILNSLLKGLI